MPVAHVTPLGAIVREQPRAAELFERLGLDYCCGGRQTLADACVRRGLDPAAVVALLDALPPDGADDGSRAAHAVAQASITELCEHILIRHHGPSHPAMDRVAHLLATVVRVHGDDHPELVDVQRLFAATRSELEAHMQVEESTLFPACRALDARRGAGNAAFDERLLALLEDDHASTGDALGALRERAGGFDTSAALCATHAMLLGELRAFEADLHQHVHEENNILFPRVRERLTDG